MSTELHVPARDRPRTALFVSAAIALVMALLVAALAIRDPAATRIARSPLLGNPAPALAGRTIDDTRTYSLDDHRGEFVVVNFFATWCVPCIEEHDDLTRFSARHARIGDASVVSVVFSDDLDAVRRFFRTRGGDWPVLRDDEGDIATAWGVARVPESYLVAPDGTVVGKITGGVTDDFLDQQLAKLTGSAARPRNMGPSQR